MQVKLVSVTKPEVEGLTTAENLIVYCARVSNPKNQLNTETGPKLLKYCLDHKHFSIFEMAHMTLEIETSRAIAAQILRHRSFVFQEYSQRFSEVTEFELYEPRRQDLKNRQNSIDDLPAKDKDWFMNALIGVNTASKALYDEAIRRNIAKESARFLLPLSTKTTLYMSGSVRSWLHYIEVRTDPSTQLEHREIAEEIKKVFIKQFPNIAKAKGWLDEN
jgi:thymidylate synthase (FAD)